MLEFLNRWLSPAAVEIPTDVNINFNIKIDLTVRHAVTRPRTPGPMVTTLISEDAMDVLHYDVTLPAAGTDVETREFTVAVEGRPDMVTTLPKSALLAQFGAPQDSLVKLSLVDIDDAGNRSAPSVLSFKAIDTLPPAAPGGLQATLVSEEEVADPAPTPEPTPEPTPAPETPPTPETAPAE